MTSKEVKEQWESIKESESKSPTSDSILDGVASHGPALLTALNYSKKAAKLGFDWNSPADCLAKVEEEINEIKHAKNDINMLEEEIGDLLFAVVSFARKTKIDPSRALRKASNKFKTRFTFLEKTLKEQEIDWNDASLDAMNKIWNEYKMLHE